MGEPLLLQVVGPQFCQPQAAALTVTRSGLCFTVTDAGGAVVMWAEGSYFKSRRRRLVLFDAASVPLLTMRRKAFGTHYTWEVYRGNNTSTSNLLFTVRRSVLPQLKPVVDIFLAENTTQNVSDFRIKCGYFGKSSALYLDSSNTTLAQINRTFNSVSDVMFRESKFSVNVFPHVDSAFVMALVMIMDEMAREKLRAPIQLRRT